MAQAKPAPTAKELFLASLAATGLVYGVGILVIAALVIVTSSPQGAGEAFRDGLVFLGFFSTIGVAAAAIAAFVLVAPLGTAFGKLVLRLTPAAWWQGPATGALVALAVVASTLALLASLGEPLDNGTYAMALIPVALAPLAGAFVQYRILRWAAPSGFARG